MKSNLNYSINISFEKPNSTDYSYIGYGELICNKQPLTIFSGIRLHKKISTDITSFSLNIAPHSINTLSDIFQTYKINILSGQFYLNFTGNETFPSRSLKFSIISDSKDTSELQKLLNILPDSELIIEQDQFWAEED